jgi:predicted helicase
VTSRDSWCYNSARASLEMGVHVTLSFYEQERARFQVVGSGLSSAARAALVDTSINADKTKISWSRALKADLARGKMHDFDRQRFFVSLYRPFFKQHFYFDRALNEMVYQMPKLFPQVETVNLLICVNGSGGKKGPSVLISEKPMDFNCLEAGAQCFPLYLYDRPEESGTDDLFAKNPATATRSQRSFRPKEKRRRRIAVNELQGRVLDR